MEVKVAIKCLIAVAIPANGIDAFISQEAVSGIPFRGVDILRYAGARFPFVSVMAGGACELPVGDFFAVRGVEQGEIARPAFDVASEVSKGHVAGVGCDFRNLSRHQPCFLMTAAAQAFHGVLSGLDVPGPEQKAILAVMNDMACAAGTQ